MTDPTADEEQIQRAERDREWHAPATSSEPLCPTCGHAKFRHATEQHWPEGTCSICRREMNRFEYGTPRLAEDVCKLTSAQVGEAIA